MCYNNIVLIASPPVISCVHYQYCTAVCETSKVFSEQSLKFPDPSPRKLLENNKKRCTMLLTDKKVKKNCFMVSLLLENKTVQLFNVL